MKHPWKRSLACLVALLLMLQLFPTGALAAGQRSADDASLVEAATEHTQLLTNPLADSEPELQIDRNQEVTFLVELEEAPLISRMGKGSDAETLQSVEAQARYAVQQAQVQARQQLQTVEGLEIVDTYSLLLNGFSVTAPYGQKEAIAALPGVRAVEVAQTYAAPKPPVATVEPNMHNSGSVVHVSKDYTGKGMLVGILDTGLDVNHEAFATEPAGQTMTRARVQTAMENLNLHATGDLDQIYVSGKVPFAYDYADGDTDVNDVQGHGTHVAGTVAANCSNLTGMAPDAQLAIFKVFSDTQSGTGDTWILPALEDAVKLGVDVINMSLGMSCGFSSENEVMDRVYSRVEDAGIVLMISAGNEGTSTANHRYGSRSLASNPDSATVGSPSMYDAALCVASVENVKKYMSYFMAGDLQVTYNDPGAGEAFTSLNGTYAYVAVPGYGEESDYVGLNLNGKIALVMRGSISFTDKEAAAAAAGAVGMVVYDNAPGSLTNMQVEGIIPSCFISLEDGTKMKTASQKAVTISPDFSDFMENEDAGQMSVFSSWGPAPDLALKPEITAPGGHIYSSLPGGGYGDSSGTSMASPHMAGIAAGVLQYVKGVDAFRGLSTYRQGELVDVLLMSTAVPLQDPAGVLYSPRSQGAGVANMEAATQTRGYLTSINGKPAKGELGSNEEGSFRYTFYVHNFGDEMLQYQLNTSVMVPETYEEDGIQFMADQDRLLTAQEYTLTYSGNVAGGKVSVAPGGRALVTVQVDLTEEGQHNLAAFPNGIYVEGFITLEALSDGGTDLGAPFLGFYGDWYEAPILEPTAYDEGTALTDQTVLGLFRYEDGNGFVLGMNRLTEEFEQKYLMVSSDYCMYNGVSALVYQLRNAKQMRFSVTRDDTGEEYYSNVVENASKSIWYPNYNLFSYSVDSNMWNMTCSYGNGLISRVPDGAYTYTVEAWGEGASDEDVQSFSLPLIIDSEDPRLVSYEAVEEDGKLYLDVELADNYFVMAAQLVDETGQIALSEGVQLAGDQPGEVSKLRFDLTFAQQVGFTMGRIYMLDYAYNEARSDMVSLELGGFRPKSVTVDPSQGTAAVGYTWDLEAIVRPEEYLTAEQRQVTWSVSDESIATITQDGKLTGIAEGMVIVTATAYNGVSGSTQFYFSQREEQKYTQIPDTDAYTITENGRYQLPLTQSSSYIHLLVDPAVTSVILRGDPNVTYRDLKIHCPSKTFLMLQDVHISLELNSSDHRVSDGYQWQYYGAINFEGEDSSLFIEGENSIIRDPDQADTVAAICVRAKKDEIHSSVRFDGTGTMTIDSANPTSYASFYTAAIGGRQGERTGDMTFNGGTWIVRNNGFGACIGSGTSSGSQYDSTLYTSKIEINYGTLDLETSHTSTEVGACIGTGSSSYNGIEIVINGGDIQATSWYGGAAIGSGMYGHSNSYAWGAPGVIEHPTTVTINGGNIRAYSKYHEDASAKSPAAAIGSGYRAATYVPVTINGGQVYAQTNTWSAAIGNGESDKYANSKVEINGGVVTAVSTAEGAAIGGGGLTSAATTAAGGIITINGGSVKTVATGTGDAVGNSAGSQATVHVWNQDSVPVYEVPIPAANSRRIYLTGRDVVKISGSHPDDENLYLYLPEGTYRADVYYEDYTYKSFDVVVTPEGSTVHEEGFVQMYQITTNLTGLTSNAPETVEEGKALSFTMSPEKGFGLPLAIQVTMGGQNLLAYQYSYDPESGLFALESVTGDVVITAEGVSGIQTFPVVAQLQHMTYNGPDYASIGKTVIGTLIPDAGYALPEVISVTMGGQATEHYTYDPAAGTVTVTQVTGDVVISGAATLIGGRTITYQLTHLTHNGPTEYVAGQDLTMYLTPDAGYFLPETVSVTGDQEVIRYTYNPNTGCLTIWNATGNLTIQAEAQSDAPAEVAVAINPTELTVDNKPGLKGQFTAIVTGAEDVTVAWSLSGNTSDETRVEAGQLFLGADETAKTLTVTATANADPSKSASAVVYVVEAMYTITIGEMAHGTVTADCAQAAQGTLVTLTVLPETGYTLKAGSLQMNGTPLEGTTFVMPDADVVITAEFENEAEALLAAARAAQKAAEEAQKKAEEAQKAAEAAQKAAEEAAASTAEDKEAAEKAQAAAEAAKARAEAAQIAAETAQAAAEAAAEAAENSNLAAAEEARKSAEEAAKSAASAAEAAEKAAQAADAMVKAQAAQAAAEEAARIAQEAQKKAEEAQKKAEEAASSSAEDKEAAEKAAKEAQEAMEAAENAQKSAEEAKQAAETAKEAAESANVEAAASAALAAEYAQKVTETYGEIVKIKAEMVDFLADAQKAAEEAEKAQKAAEEAQKKAEEAALQAAKYHALMTLATYADKDLYARPQQAELAAAIQAGQEAIDAATTPQEVEEALTAAMTAIDGIKTLAELNKEKLPFTDVKEGDWYYRAVRYAVQQGLFKGVTDTTFAPNSKLNRAMAVTILYRLAGEPESTEQVTFTDVKEGAYYYKAVAWALENGITTGVDATRFAPNADVTREQMVTFLHRYAEVSGQDVNRMASLSSFRDAGSVSNYAREAMAWAVGNGILQGMEQDLLAPQGTATRAQAAAILMRFLTR